jgi:aryl-alcohol dehydrogenase-like predicted oxidoreductase
MRCNGSSRRRSISWARAWRCTRSTRQPPTTRFSPPDVLAAMRQLREERSVAIGVTVTGPHQAEVIDAAIELDQFDTIQATWNLLANGRLAGGEGQPALLDAAAQRRIAPDTLALSAALAQPWADIVLSGAVTMESLHSNIAASPRHWDPELGEGLAPRLARTPAAYWQERSQRPWA